MLQAVRRIPSMIWGLHLHVEWSHQLLWAPFTNLPPPKERQLQQVKVPCMLGLSSYNFSTWVDGEIVHQNRFFEMWYTKPLNLWFHVNCTRGSTGVEECTQQIIYCSCALCYLIALCTTLFAPFESWIVDFPNSCWIIEQSYHRANTPSIYSTIRVVVLMGPSIRLREGQTHTCTIKWTHTRTRT